MPADGVFFVASDMIITASALDTLRSRGIFVHYGSDPRSVAESVSQIEPDWRSEVEKIVRSEYGIEDAEVIATIKQRVARIYDQKMRSRK